MTLPVRRFDRWLQREVIIAADRAARPQQVASVTQTKTKESVPDSVFETGDPFLEGQESNTPSESVALRRTDSDVDQPGWLVRVVPNRYPAVVSENFLLPSANTSVAGGIHEVVIECPDFRTGWHQFSVGQIARVLGAWQRRQKVLMSQSAVQAIQVFRNEGPAAGASLAHSHSQIIALMWLPESLKHRWQRIPDLVNSVCDETNDRRRLIHSGEYIVYCPEASSAAGQIRILPESLLSGPAADFCSLSKSDVCELARWIKASVDAIRKRFDDVSLNVVLHTPPANHPPEEVRTSGWVLDLLPRTSAFAGFELGTGILIVADSPEAAADHYRREWNLPNPADMTDVVPLGYHWRP